MKGCGRRHSICKIYKSSIYIIAIILILHFIVINSSVYYRRTIYLPFSMHLNRQDLVMIKGEEFKLFVYGINKRVSYSSSNFRVASVNLNGKIYALQTGKAYIIAKVDGRVLKCRVRVIDLNKEKLVLSLNGTYRLKVKGTLSLPRWKSSNNNIASVNMFGKIKAKRKGSTVITATIKGRKLRCVVTIK